VGNNEVVSEVGYGKPPRQTQFVKGQSGNPTGRPKGSQNLATVLAKAGRQRVKITENGRTRHVTKFEATMLQLLNKAASGDLKAIAELLDWIKSFSDSDQPALASTSPHERDASVMESIVERIRNSQTVMSHKLTDASDPSRRET
jgi:hypothetical protein